MTTFMTCPTLRPHGGVRVILEWANRIPDVVVHVPRIEPVEWMRVAPHVRFTTRHDELATCETLIITSPHGAELINAVGPRKRFVFLQMLEHMFRERNARWRRVCARLYRAPEPLVLISRWNERVIREEFRRTGPTFRVGNGIDLGDFPIDRTPKSGGVVLVEGWNPGNATKDIDGIGPSVAVRLKAEGCTIIGYGRDAPKEKRHVLDEYHVSPDLDTLNRLYSAATILVKATKYDARSCAPIEAMTKGTVTARAIIEGDDDLDPTNSLRVGYDADALYRAARRLLDDDRLRDRLSTSCLRYAEEHSWDEVWPDIEAVIS